MIRMLQNGQDENLKKVRMTRFPFIADMSNVVPSIAGSVKLGASSPTESCGMFFPVQSGNNTLSSTNLIGYIRLTSLYYVDAELLLQ